MNWSEYYTLIKIPIVVLVASFIIIVFCISSTNANGLSALIGGYMGVLIGLVMILALNIPIRNWTEVFPFGMLFLILILSIYYLFAYFHEIIQGHVSYYYYSFSALSILLLGAQLYAIVNELLKGRTSAGNLFNDRTFALINLYSVIQFIDVVILGVILSMYSTQG